MSVFESPHDAVVWGMVLLVSFAGWGGVVARIVLPGHHIDLGLRLAWGMAALLAAGGIGCELSVATRPVLLGVAWAGVAAAGVQAWLDRKATQAPGPAVGGSFLTTAVLLAAIALLAIQFYFGATGGRLSTDDFSAYLVHPQKILSTGTLTEPFSLRRLSSYGGQSFMQALTLLGASDPWQISLFDQGICLAVVIALIVADRWTAPPGPWLMPLCVLLVLPDIRGNSASQMSGVALFLALFRTAASPLVAAQPRRGAILLGLLAGAVTTLRQWYLVGAVAFLGLYYLPSLVASIRLHGSERWGRLADPLIAVATLVLVLTPWAALSFSAIGTPLYPMFQGNYRAEYGSLLAGNPKMDRWTFLWRNASFGYPVRAIPLFLLAALLLPWKETRGALPALAAASTLGFVVIVVGFPLSDVLSMSRYYFAFVVSLTVATLLHVGTRSWAGWRRDGRAAAVGAALAVGAAAVEMLGGAPLLVERQRDLLGMIRARSDDLSLEATRPYRALQDAIPPGAPMIVMFDQPYLFDFNRNPIEVIDLPGQVSPPPGMPFDSDDALASYLMEHGYRYLAFVLPDRSMNQYRRDGWRRMMGPPASPLWGRAAPIILQALDRLESVARSRWSLYDDGKFVAVDLAARIR